MKRDKNTKSELNLEDLKNASGGAFWKDYKKAQDNRTCSNFDMFGSNEWYPCQGLKENSALHKELVENLKKFSLSDGVFSTACPCCGKTIVYLKGKFFKVQ